MAIPTYNPFSYLDDSLADGFDYMIANLPGTPSFQDIIDTTIAYLQSFPEPPSPELLNVFTQIASVNANNYINSKIAETLDFDNASFALVDSVLSGIKENTIDSLTEFLSNTDEQIATSCSYQNSVSSSSLYTASALAKSSNAYWQVKALTPGSWSTYLSGNAAIDYSNIPHWVTASYVASLGGYAQIITSGNTNLILNTTAKLGDAPNCAMANALAITTAKIILKWPQRSAASCDQTNQLMATDLSIVQR